MSEFEFYVGYLPKAPVAIGRRVRIAVVFLFVIAAVCAIGFVRVQRTFAPSAFEYGKERTFTGIIETKPYPVLLVPRPNAESTTAGFSRYLLVAAGKHGADDQTVPFAGKNVRLHGSLIYRQGQTMIEVVRGSIVASEGEAAANIPPLDLGMFSLVGEIVDSKCFLGVMNPGNGKVHHDCAVRCLSGGVPPVFATNDFRGVPALLNLADPDGNPLPKKEFLDRVAQPIRIRGRVFQTGDSLLLETNLADASSQPN